MRVAVLNWSDRRFGGTGSYLRQALPALRERGHEVALWHEVSEPVAHTAITDAEDVPAWSVAKSGLDVALGDLSRWRPDVLYAHGLLDPGVEARVLDRAPAVFFAHDYYGACISGSKSFSRPAAAPCGQAFGWGCLARYYPRRCGGVNPVTMVEAFRRQRRRLRLLSRYAAIVTHSDHMRQVYIDQGFGPERVVNVRFGVAGTEQRHVTVAGRQSGAVRLLFAGRMERLKGGRELLLALPVAAGLLHRPIELTFAGQGSMSAEWASLAQEICRDRTDIAVRFLGWADETTLQGMYAGADLLVVPSLWPEPLGLVGLEAAASGLPAVGFDVGGISDWLRAGTNGFLAPGDPPTPDGLAHAIASGIEDPVRHQRLREGARRVSESFRFDRHIDLLTDVLEGVAA